MLGTSPPGSISLPAQSGRVRRRAYHRPVPDNDRESPEERRNRELIELLNERTG